MALTPLSDLDYGVAETLQNAAGATGAGTSIDMRGVRYLALDVAGTFVGTVTFQGSIDGGATWFGIALLKAADGTYALTATAAGDFFLPYQVAALSDFRANITAWTSGTITVKTRKQS